MIARLGNAFIIFTLCCAIGLQWLGLQSIAWTKMLIENSRHGRFCQAISQTLDGAHPCSLCHFVNQEKNSEKKSDFLRADAKLDIISLARASRITPPFTRFDYSPQTFAIFKISYSPPSPPPRYFV